MMMKRSCGGWRGGGWQRRELATRRPLQACMGGRCGRVARAAGAAQRSACIRAARGARTSFRDQTSGHRETGAAHPLGTGSALPCSPYINWRCVSKQRFNRSNPAMRILYRDGRDVITETYRAIPRQAQKKNEERRSRNLCAKDARGAAPPRDAARAPRTGCPRCM
jgi:hypothetical protein